MGENSKADGDFSFAVGSQSQATGDRAAAIGYQADAHAAGAVAIGQYVNATAANSFVLGTGPGLPGLTNDVENSLIVGFDDTEPILFVGGPVGRVGIGTTEPEGALHVVDKVKIGPTGIGSPGGAGLVVVAEASTVTNWPLLVMNPDPQVLFRVRGDGRVGVGPTMPLTRTHIVDAALDLTEDALKEDVAIVEADDAILGLYSSEAGTGGSAVTFSEVNGGALVDKWALVRESTTGGSGLRISYGTNRDQFQNSIMMYLNDDGKVGIGTTTFGSDRFKVSGSACATAWNSCSDIRFKKNIEGIEGAVEKVLKLRGVRFRWRREEYQDRGFPEGQHYGVIAQEAETVVPEIVTTGPDGERSIAYAEIVPLLVESIRELKAENLTLRARIQALESVPK
jgi:hypothetical protein